MALYMELHEMEWQEGCLAHPSMQAAFPRRFLSMCFFAR